MDISKLDFSTAWEKYKEKGLKKSDWLNMTFEDWKKRTISMYGCDVSEGVLRPLFDDGCSCLEATRKLQAF